MCGSNCEMRLCYSCGIAWQQIDSTIYISNEKNGEDYILENVSALFWKAIGEQKSIQVILEEISAIYAVEQSELREDIQQLVDDLVMYNLIYVIEE